jgi:hypothetical protein
MQTMPPFSEGMSAGRAILYRPLRGGVSSWVRVLALLEFVVVCVALLCLLVYVECVYRMCSLTI